MPEFDLDNETYPVELDLSNLTIGDLRIAKYLLGDPEAIKNLKANDPEAITLTLASAVLRKHPDWEIRYVISRVNTVALTDIRGNDEAPAEDDAAPLVTATESGSGTSANTSGRSGANSSGHIPAFANQPGTGDPGSVTG